MTDRFHVAVKVWIPAELHRELARHAAHRDLDVGQLLARLAERSIKPKRRYVKITPAILAMADDLRARGYSWREVERRLRVSRKGLLKAQERPAATDHEIGGTR